MTGRVAALGIAACWLLMTACDSSPKRKPQSAAPDAITVESSSFRANGPIPARFTCDGQQVSPALSWSGVPAGTVALALVVDDPDAPRGTFTHWVAVDIDPGVTAIGEGEAPPGARQIANSAGQAAYTGPCPPSGTHHYRFTVYALPRRIAPKPDASLGDVLAAISSAATAQGQLVGTYRR